MDALTDVPAGYLGVELIDAPLHQAVEDAQRWLRPAVAQEEVFAMPEMRPYAYRPGHAYGCFWSPRGRPSGTALVANCAIGFNLARRFKHPVLGLRMSAPDDEWPICELSLYEQGALKRFVRAFRDDTRWDFFEQGERLPFEKDEYYRKRRIRDRLTPELLRGYSLALGWDLAPSALFASDRTAVSLIHRPDSSPSSARLPAGPAS